MPKLAVKIRSIKAKVKAKKNKELSKIQKIFNSKIKKIKKI